MKESKLYRAWLQYPLPEGKAVREAGADGAGIPGGVRVFGGLTPVLRSAVAELAGAADRADIIAGAAAATDWRAYGIDDRLLAGLHPEGFLLRALTAAGAGSATGGKPRILLIGGSDRGVLYGAFHLMRLLAIGHPLEHLDVTEAPGSELRMVNHWDNADGSIERGYAGKSIFYAGGEFRENLGRVRDYARLLASVGINAVSINNVNVHETETLFITEPWLPKVARVADIFREYGIRLFLSINFAAPVQAGGLPTADPLDEGVRTWWKRTAAAIYRHIPDFGGFLVKADSEHRPGPFTYGRDHADGANMLAEALAPHGGLVIWRCFVYNCMQDWRDRKTDRARAAYDHFTPLDGRFADNVILQIKNGPMDFQVREPVHPLFGALPNTNVMMEFQITQEYTGQQRHLCYLVPQWKEVLDFDTHARGPGSAVKDIVTGRLFGASHGGFAGVSNIGDDENWTGHTLAQANLYGYGRLAWNPDLSAEQIAEEWVRLTFGNDGRVVDVITGMLMDSWPIYEKYTAPLGVGWMVTPHTHYGPDVDGYEYSRWGTYHFCRPERHRGGPDDGLRDGIHRPIFRSEPGYVRAAGHVPGRTAAVFPPRALFARAPVGQDGHPAHLRHPFRRGGGGGAACRTVAQPEGARR